MNIETTTIEDLGYNSFFESERIKLGLEKISIARVITESKGSYRVKNQNGEFIGKVTGKQIHNALSRVDYPAVGDWVTITEADKEHAVIHSILPRKSIIKRKNGNKNKIGEKKDIQIIATNIDVAFIVESVDRDYNLNRFERYFSIVKDGGVEPVIILTKIDLIEEDVLNERINELNNRFSNVDIVLTSTLNNSFETLKQYIKRGKTYCFLGSSGVGKSSLINKLIGKDIIKTGDISSTSQRGKHTTTKRQMFFLDNGGIVIDNPGIREVGITDINGVNNFFDNITTMGNSCKYRDCTHTNEPGCKVIENFETGELDKEQYFNYLNLKKEAEYYNMSEMEKREKDYKFGKFMKNSKKELKKFKK